MKFHEFPHNIFKTTFGYPRCVFFRFIFFFASFISWTVSPAVMSWEWGGGLFTTPKIPFHRVSGVCKFWWVCRGGRIFTQRGSKKGRIAKTIQSLESRTAVDHNNGEKGKTSTASICKIAFLRFNDFIMLKFIQDCGRTLSLCGAVGQAYFFWFSSLYPSRLLLAPLQGSPLHSQLAPRPKGPLPGCDHRTRASRGVGRPGLLPRRSTGSRLPERGVTPETGTNINTVFFFFCHH